MRCEFMASDDAAGLFYALDWRDGNVTRIPARGFVAPGIKVAAVHAFAAEDAWNLSLRATSNESVPRVSDDALFRLSVVNKKPVLRGYGCTAGPTAAGAPVDCWLYAADASP